MAGTRADNEKKVKAYQVSEKASECCRVLISLHAMVWLGEV